MIGNLWSEKMRDYAPVSAMGQENALQELAQLSILASLGRAGFFSEAAFCGGTCLRLLHGAERFSEDLDFVTRQPSPQFKWAPLLEQVRRDCEGEGLRLEIQDKSGAFPGAVKKAFLKTDGLGAFAGLKLPFRPRDTRRIRIKVEIDTNPPAGAVAETRYIHFPFLTPVTAHTLSSGFGGKLHALLCRSYAKGRDWHDFLWYVSKKIAPNLLLLSAAMDQQGPWAGQGIPITPQWLRGVLTDKIHEIDWGQTREDARRFLPLSRQNDLDLWSPELFLYHVDALWEIIGASNPDTPG